MLFHVPSRPSIQQEGWRWTGLWWKAESTVDNTANQRITQKPQKTERSQKSQNPENSGMTNHCSSTHRPQKLHKEMLKANTLRGQILKEAVVCVCVCAPCCMLVRVCGIPSLAVVILLNVVGEFSVSFVMFALLYGKILRTFFTFACECTFVGSPTALHGTSAHSERRVLSPISVLMAWCCSDCGEEKNGTPTHLGYLQPCVWGRVSASMCRVVRHSHVTGYG